nr:uncharacterized protein LOC104086937 [Nicotiana tomentosiformis]
MPDVPKYDGTSDPHEDITTYTTVVKENDLAPHEIESVSLKKFGETLMKGALTWYSLFPEHSIDSFEMISNSFIKAHAEARKVQARKTDIFRIAQGESELLQEFVTVFQKEMMLLPVIPGEWVAEEFTKGARDMVAGAARLAVAALLSADEELCQVRERRTCEAFAAGVGPQMRPKAPHVRKSLGNECEYHGTNGHQNGDCRHLGEELATLLKNTYLRKFLSDQAKNNYGRSRDNTEPSKEGEDPPHLTINMIFGGNKINGMTFSAAQKTKVSVTHCKRHREVAEDDITFTEEDADGLLLPHNNALVISQNVLDFKFKTANIIQWRVLEQVKLTRSIIPTTKLLTGFNLSSVTTRGEILMLTNVEGVIKMTLFEVPEGTDATKSTKEELEQVTLFKKFLERKFHLGTGLHLELRCDRYPAKSGRAQAKLGP